MATFSEVLEAASKLSLQEQAYLVEILQQRLIPSRRNGILSQQNRAAECGCGTERRQATN